MKDIKFRQEDTSKVESIFSKIYNLMPSEYTASKSADGTTVVSVDDSKHRYDPKVIITYDDDEVEAYISVYPSIGGEAYITIDSIMNAIRAEGVDVNINLPVLKEVADLHLKDYVVDKVLFARGIHAYPGKDVIFMFHFTDTTNKPAITADGKVDFKELNNINSVKDGDILVTKRPATMGIRGLTVRNVEVPAEPGKDMDIMHGSGVAINPAGTNYVATTDGYVDFTSNILQVLPVYIVHGDVDYSVGNIDFVGTVHVKGDLLPGFTIKATKDVIIDGICGDSEIRAGKSIFIKQGVKGSGKSLYKAGLDIKVGFVERGCLQAIRDIIINRYSYSSDLFAGGRVEAVINEGIIAGGIVKSYNKVRAKQLGTEGNSNFTIHIGTQFFIDQALEDVRRQKVRMVESLQKIEVALGGLNLSDADIVRNPQVIKLTALKRDFQNTINEMADKEEEYRANPKAKQPKIKVSGRVFEGVTMIFFNSSTTTRERLENVMFYFDQKYAEIAWVSLKDAMNIELIDQ